MSRSDDGFVAEVQASSASHSYHATGVTHDLYPAIDEAHDKIKRQIRDGQA
nr:MULTISPECIES: HPF/RaiA family ribosome-associated protein [unclassified Nannocystis]